MVKLKSLLIVLFLALGFSSKAQTCDCVKNFEWLQSTFEKNDAGFQYVIEQKGVTAYKEHNVKTVQEVKNAQTEVDCYVALNTWLQFFRKGHLYLQLLKYDEGAIDTLKIRETFKNWKQITINLSEFKKTLSREKKVGFQGIWQLNNYKVGIVRQDETYVGFIIEADGVHWSKNQIKFEFKIDENNKAAGSYYMQDHAAQPIDELYLFSNNNLVINGSIWKRVEYLFEESPEVVRYFNLMNTKKPQFLKLSDTSVLLRIPSFSEVYKKDIDSLVEANHKTIINTPHLLIDIRNNGGGSDYSYENILPYLYTQPFKLYEVEMLSTPLNNSRYDRLIKSGNFSKELIEKFSLEQQQLNSKLNQFVNLSGEKLRELTFDIIYTSPQKVSILINGGNASSAEEFILTAKQSRKVKLYGTTTAGILDISNMNQTVSPDGCFKLGYALSRSLRLPEYPVDPHGIAPDVYIDNNTPKYEWINFVEKSNK